MLAVISIWAYTLAAAGLVGWAGSRILQKLLKFNSAHSLPFAVHWLMGMGLLTCVLSFLSLVLPLSWLAQLIVLALTLAAFLAWQKGRWQSIRHAARDLLHLPRLILALLILAAGTILILATAVPFNSDTGLYHAQTIRWIETYPAVPGLANFQSRLGFNSSWLLAQASFSFAFLGIQSFHLNTSALFLVASLYFGMAVCNLARGSRRYSDWMRAIFFPLVFYILSSEISSPGNDAPVALITWIVTAEWLAFFEERHPAEDLRPVVLSLISVYAVTIKLSALPLAGFGVAVMAARLFRRQWRGALFTAGLAVLFLLPWMARSVLLSGYLLYPYAGIDIFNVDWKVPPAMVQYEAETIRDWAIIPRSSVERVQSMSLRARTIEWWLNQTVNRRGILLADLAAPFLYLILAFWGRLRPFLAGLFKTAWPVWLATYVGLVYWFFSAPDFRFGEGPILAGLALAVAPLAVALQEKVSFFRRALPWAVVAILAAYQGFMLVSSVDVKTLPQRLLLPADYPMSPTRPCVADQVTILIPEEISYGLCWYGVFPCIPYCNQQFERRGTGWQDGFRYKEPVSSP